LPRPKHLNSEILLAHVNAATDSVQKIIAQEMTALILQCISLPSPRYCSSQRRIVRFCRILPGRNDVC
jgi:hypothetical protein